MGNVSSLFALAAGGIISLFLSQGAYAQSAPIQMLPPTMLNALTSPCTGGNYLLSYSASSVANTAGINCSLLTTDTSGNLGNASGELHVLNRIFSGNQTTGGNGGMWVGPNQFVGSLDATELGFYNNGGWNLTVGNTGIVTVDGTLNVDSNQIWNSSTNLYLNYSTNSPAAVIIGGAAYEQDLDIPNGNLTIGNPSNTASIVLNGNSTQFTPATCHIVTNYGPAPTYASDARCASDEFALNGGGYVDEPTFGTFPGCAIGPQKGFIHTNMPDFDGQGWSIDAFQGNGAGEACTVAYATCCKR